VVLDRRALDQLLQEWLSAWNRHDLEAVLASMAEGVVFEHWDGKPLSGKATVRRAWERWFARDKDFRFEWLNTIIDETTQKVSFEWRLHWISPVPDHAGEREIRDGIDVIQFRNGEIVSKRTYIKTGPRMKPFEPAPGAIEGQ
jgi:ketosteroid isomerase-like protein